MALCRRFSQICPPAIVHCSRMHAVVKAQRGKMRADEMKERERTRLLREIGDQKRFFGQNWTLSPGPSAATRTAPPLLAALLGRAADDFSVDAVLRAVETGACLAREAREGIGGTRRAKERASQKAERREKKCPRVPVSFSATPLFLSLPPSSQCWDRANANVAFRTAPRFQ